MTAKAPAKGHTAKHTAPSKAQAKKKPSPKHAPAKQKKPVTAQAKGAAVHTAAKPAKPAKPAGFAIGDLLPVCAAEAVAMSLRLAGGAVSDEDVLRLHVLAAGAEDAPASIPGALEAAFRFGLAGLRPVKAVSLLDEARVLAGGFDEVLLADLGVARRNRGHALILRIDHPGSHAVLATPDGWWSWGALYSPWNARAEEAWLVQWAAQPLTPADSASRGALAVDVPAAQLSSSYAAGDAA